MPACVVAAEKTIAAPEIHLGLGRSKDRNSLRA